MVSKSSILLSSLFFLTTFSFAQPISFENRGIGGGGALFSPAISHHDSDIVFMSCDMTELFFSETGGQFWDFMPSEELTAFQNSEVQFTSNPALLYVLAMEFRNELTFPVKSTNGGQSWGPIADPTNGEALYLYANPEATDELIIGTWGSLYYSGNGGTNWNLIFNDAGFNLHIAGVFWDNNNIYIGSNYGLIISNNSGQSASLDADPGLPANVGFSTFSGAKSGNTISLYGIGLHEADLYPTVQAWEFSGYQGIFKRQMGDNPGNWENISNGIANGVGLYQVATSGTDTEIAYVAGTNSNNSYPVVYKTTNGGTNWEAIFQTQNNENIETGWSGYQGDEDWYYGEYALGLAVSFSDPDQIALTDLGFMHRSTNGGQSWKQNYVHEDDANDPGNPTPKDRTYQGNGLENTSAWWIHWTMQEICFSAFTDIGGMSSSNDGYHWTFDHVDRSLNSTYQFIQGTNNTLYAATSSVHDLYQSTYLTDNSIDNGSGRILFSTDQGASWQVLENFDHPVVSMAIDPNNPDVMYAAVVHSTQGGIYKTSDLLNESGASWTKLSDPPRTEGHPLSLWVLNDGTVVSSFAGRRASNFTQSSGVFYSIDGGNSWEDRSHPDMFYWTKDLIIDPNDPDQNTWYACVFSGWGGAANDKGGLFRSTDRGQNWEEILDLFRVESIGIQPGNENVAYVSTEDEGLWYTSNLSSNQVDFQKLDSYKFLHPLRIFFNPFNTAEVWITSFGNGMSVGANAVSLDQIEKEFSFSINPNPSSGIAIIEFRNSETTDLIEVWSITGQLIYCRKKIIGSQSEVIDLSDVPNGVYYVKLISKNAIQTKPLIINK